MEKLTIDGIKTRMKVKTFADGSWCHDAPMKIICPCGYETSGDTSDESLRFHHQNCLKAKE